MTKTTIKWPINEEFLDCAGERREFRIAPHDTVSEGFLLEAAEIRDDNEPGYSFSVFSEAYAIYGALGRLRRKIRCGLSRRYMIEGEMLTDELRGDINYGGLVVDGRFIDFNKLADQIQTYEGFSLEIRILEPDA